MFSISPLTLFLLTLSLAMLRVARRRSARAVGVGAGVIGAASVASLIFLIRLWSGRDEVPGKIIILSVLGFYVAIFLAFAAIMLSEKLAEDRRFQAAGGIWILMFLLLMRGFQRDYIENIWFMDVMNNMLYGLIGAGQPGQALSACIDAFGKVNLFVAKYFLELATAGTLALAYVFYILVGAYYEREKYIAWQSIRPPRLSAAFAAVIIIIHALIKHFTQGPIESDFLQITIHIVIGIYLLHGILVLSRGIRVGGAMRIAALVAALAAAISQRPLEIIALIGYADNLVGISGQGLSTRTISNKFARRFIERAASVKGFAVMIIITVICVPVFSAKTIRPLAFGGAQAGVSGSAPENMKLIVTRKGRFYMDIHEFPNREGIIPEHGISYTQAAGICRQNQKRLCTADEWEAACRGPHARMYEFADNGNESHHILNKRCNTRPMGIRREGIAAGGSTDCVNELGIRDMTGNVWEWVDNGDGPFRALKGSSYQYNDDYTTLCSTKVLLLDTQIKKLKLPTVGLRCCKDAN